MSTNKSYNLTKRKFKNPTKIKKNKNTSHTRVSKMSAKEENI